jgi:hypothetical protein
LRSPASWWSLLVVHHVLLLPNQSIGLLAPAMGGCLWVEDVDPAGREPSEFARLCLDGLHGSVALSGLTGVAPGAHLPLPAAYRLFVLVPLAATIAGGRRAARGALGIERIVRASGAGVVFAALVLAGSWLAAITVPFGIPDMRAPVLFHLGPPPIRTAAIAVAWGVLGGLLGSLWERRAQTLPGEPELPSPTSVK